MKHTISIAACVSLISTFCLGFKVQAQIYVPNTIMPDPILLNPIGNVAEPEESDLTQETSAPAQKRLTTEQQERCFSEVQAASKSTVEIANILNKKPQNNIAGMLEAQGQSFNALSKCLAR
jgi:hypothetical protein